MEPEPLQQLDGACVRHRGIKLSYFGGCDYFRLSRHPRMRAALVDGLRKYGANVAASRLTTGHHQLYTQVESALCKFFRSEAALVVSNGYATNLIVAQALAGEFTHAFLDARAHVSLQDASQMLDCSVVTFPHRDAGALKRALKKTPRHGRLLVLTDGMFAHDGSTTPLDRYLDFLPSNALLLVDDAHGAGVVGANGRGTPELTNVPRSRLIQTITFSKAFGAYGGAILCSREIRERLITRSRMFAGSTPPPLPLMNMAIEGLRLLGPVSSFRDRLAANVRKVRNALPHSENTFAQNSQNASPVIPLLPRDARHARAIAQALRAQKIFASPIKYPGGPPNGYFRLVISSEHSPKQLNALIAALRVCYA